MSAVMVIGDLGIVTADQLADILAPRPEGVCGWLDDSCDVPVAAGEWLCDRHRARAAGGER